MSTLISRILGKVSLVDNTYLEVGITAGTFKSFKAAAKEAAISRFYGFTIR